MADKKNYKTPPPPADVEKELGDIRAKVNERLYPIATAVVKGWWIWIEVNNGKVLTKTYENILVNNGFFQAKKGRNAGSWYYKHPKAPNFRRGSYRSRRGGSSANTKPKSNPDSNKVHIKQENRTITEYEALEARLENLYELRKIDSGENHINIDREIAQIKQKLVDIENKRAKTEVSPVPTSTVQEEMVRYQYQEPPKPESKPKPKEDKPEPEPMQEDEAMDILGDLFSE